MSPNSHTSIHHNTKTNLIWSINLNLKADDFEASSKKYRIYLKPLG